MFGGEGYPRAPYKSLILISYYIRTWHVEWVWLGI